MIGLRPLRGARTGALFTGYGSPAALGPPEDARLFATPLDENARQIAVIDTTTGQETGRLPAPEARFGGSEGLAVDGNRLYYLGIGRYPALYELDPATGDVRRQEILAVGSGYFWDAAVIAGELYLLDIRDQSIQVFDPVVPRWLRTLPVRSQHGVSVGGGLAALSAPDRLYVADAFGTRSILELHPQTGDITGTIESVEPRPTALGGRGADSLYVSDWRTPGLTVLDRSGAPVDQVGVAFAAGSIAGSSSTGYFPDFDADGDVDLSDVSRWQRCFAGDTRLRPVGCAPADSNADDHVDLVDHAALTVALTGAKAP